jgi:aminoglycoside phosphotransferase (APT) family kinase protein
MPRDASAAVADGDRAGSRARCNHADLAGPALAATRAPLDLFAERATRAVAQLGVLGAIGAAGLALAPAAAAAAVIGLAQRAWLERDRAAAALARLGVREVPRAIRRLGGGRSNAVYAIELAARTVVLKRALPAGTVLAFAARWVGPQPFARDVSAAARIAREAAALRRLAAADVRAPRVLAVDVDAGLLLVEHLHGTPLPRALGRETIAGYARAIRAAHRAGIVLSDGHPGNALALASGEVALLDLELAELATDVADPHARRAFDLAYAAAYFTPAERAAFLGADAHAPAVRAATAQLAPYAPLFAREAVRQRRAA